MGSAEESFFKKCFNKRTINLGPGGPVAQHGFRLSDGHKERSADNRNVEKHGKGRESKSLPAHHVFSWPILGSGLTSFGMREFC